MHARLLSAAGLTAALLAVPAALLPAPAAASPAAAPQGSPAPAAASGAPKRLLGAAVYLSYGGRRPTVSRYVPGKGFTTLGPVPATGQFAASPDGRKFAWITGGGAVRVKAGRKVTTVARGAVAGAPCLTPVWSADSTRLAFAAKPATEPNRVAVVRVTGRQARTVGRTHGICHLAWSANGRYLAGYAGTTDGVFRLDLKTDRSVRVKGVRLSNHVQSLSPDGRRVIVAPLSRNDEAGDGGWPTGFRPAIVDVATGRRVPVPVRGRLLGAFYLRDGRLVVRVAGSIRNTWVVLDGSGRELQRLAEPAAARHQGLLQIIG